MLKLEEKHHEFLKLCAEKPNKVHESDLPAEDLEQMVQEGLIIKYGGVRTKFAIARYGTQFVKEQITGNGPVSPEITELAVKYVMSKGYSKAAAQQIVTEHGANYLLKEQAAELRSSGQKEVKIPVNAQGLSEIRFRKG
jgi:hypothetical protein